MNGILLLNEWNANNKWACVANKCKVLPKCNVPSPCMYGETKFIIETRDRNVKCKPQTSNSKTSKIHKTKMQKEMKAKMLLNVYGVERKSKKFKGAREWGRDR